MSTEKVLCIGGAYAGRMLEVDVASNSERLRTRGTANTALQFSVEMVTYSRQEIRGVSVFVMEGVNPIHELLGGYRKEWLGTVKYL